MPNVVLPVISAENDNEQAVFSAQQITYSIYLAMTKFVVVVALIVSKRDCIGNETIVNNHWLK